MQRVCAALLGLLGLALASCGPQGEEVDAPLLELRQHLPRQPGFNVIVVSFDALRADALGVYGADDDRSPYIDAFAEQSIVFDNAYTVAPVTPTSFAAAFTGLLPTRVFHAWNLVWDDTLARRFQQSGYKTAAFLNNPQLASERGFHSGFELYDLYGLLDDEVLVDDHVILRSSLEWLEENREEKIFAWIHFVKPHAPYEYRELADHLYDDTYEGEFEESTGVEFDTEDPREIERIKSLYAGEVLYVDGIFGQLIAGLREVGLLENSIVLVTSDHGEEFKEHGGFQHRLLTEEHVRVPLLLYHPAVRSHRRSPVLVSNVDFFPTLLSLADIETDAQLDGRDLTRISESPSWIVGVSMTGARQRWISMRQGRLKLIRTCRPEQGAVLYDLVADPGEQRDIRPERPAESRRLNLDLRTVMGGEPCQVMEAALQGADPTTGLSEENIRALKALGYLGD